MNHTLLSGKALHYYILQVWVIITIIIMFTELLTCTRHYLKCIMRLLHLSLITIKEVDILIPFYPWGNWDTKMLSNLSKVWAFYANPMWYPLLFWPNDWSSLCHYFLNSKDLFSVWIRTTTQELCLVKQHQTFPHGISSVTVYLRILSITLI